MSDFSLREPTEQADTSNSSATRAVKSGGLSVTRTDDADLSIYAAELLRAFPQRQTEQHFEGQETTLFAEVATAAAPAATDELALRFAALEAGLKELYRARQSRDQWQQEGEHATRASAGLGQRRPWWKRLVG